MLIYSPIINETIPGFISSLVKIPFKNNIGTNPGEVKWFVLIVKDINSYDIKEYFSTQASSFSFENEEIDFIVKDINIFNIGQYYKFQLGYWDGEQAPNLSDLTQIAFSSASIGRCVPKLNNLYIQDLNKGCINEQLNVYKGFCETSLQSEPEYYYQFIVRDDTNNIIFNTGKKIHSTKDDYIDIDRNLLIQSDSLRLDFELLKDKIYFLDYIITTINNYTESITYSLMYKKLISCDFDPSGLIISQDLIDKNNGFVNVHIDFNNSSGHFLLERTFDRIHYDLLADFNVESINQHYDFKDKTVEHGKLYIYSLRKVYKGQVSERIEKTLDDIIKFEDMFLSDKNRQLCIRFDPKISSFKDTLLENKVDTLGGKYPLFFRSGNTSYKEFPISGLISYLIDEDNYFLTKKELGLKTFNERESTEDQKAFPQKVYTTDLTDSNIETERYFKLKVLEWLNNGQPKLFRSPAEGNYIVRIMNVSLSPNDTLSRMLHTFSATAYEIADITFDNLINNNIINNQKNINLFTPTEQPNTLVVNPNEETPIVLEDIKNMTWETLAPSVNNYITINSDNNKIINSTGFYKSPKEMLLNAVTIYPKRSPGDMFSYKKIYPNREGIIKDSFEEEVDNPSTAQFYFADTIGATSVKNDYSTEAPLVTLEGKPLIKITFNENNIKYFTDILILGYQNQASFQEKDLVVAGQSRIDFVYSNGSSNSILIQDSQIRQLTQKDLTDVIAIYFKNLYVKINGTIYLREVKQL